MEPRQPLLPEELLNPDGIAKGKQNVLVETLSNTSGSSMKSPITCHVLDSSTGKPAEGVSVRLQHAEHGVYIFREGVTNSDGRCLNLLPPRNSDTAKDEKTDLVAGREYKIIFKTKDYFDRTNRKTFYPCVEIQFIVENPDEHYHIPLLISPFSYTTYRGS